LHIQLEKNVELNHLALHIVLAAAHR
jgi:hypothetical protein